jgi:hypothetical protein
MHSAESCLSVCLAVCLSVCLPSQVAATRTQTRLRNFAAARSSTLARTLLHGWLHAVVAAERMERIGALLARRGSCRLRSHAMRSWRAQAVIGRSQVSTAQHSTTEAVPTTACAPYMYYRYNASHKRGLFSHACVNT